MQLIKRSKIIGTGEATSRGPQTIPNFSDPKPEDTFQLNENNKCTTKSSCKIETCRS